MSILAKSTGITLDEHTADVVTEARHLLDSRGGFLDKKYRQLLGPEADLKSQVLRAAEYHDKGKMHRTWQDACQADYEIYRRTGENRGTNLMRAGLRHEFASLYWAQQRGIELTFPERVAIAAHHGKLSFRHRKRWEDDGGGCFKKLWEVFVAQCYRPSTTADLFRKTLLQRYKISAVRALLQLADTRASNREDTCTPPPPEIEAFQYTFPAKWKKRGVQKVVETFCKEEDAYELILRAPTGSGKTDAALLWATHQIKQGRADRLVIAMPTRFTSNALAINIADSVSDTGLYHSSAWYNRFGDAKDRVVAKELHRMARLLVTPVTVTTIDHLCIALTGRREDHHSIFFHLANSCLVIDEADFYDAFVQANLVVLLEALRVLQVPVLLMSATVPASARNLYDISILKEDRSDLDRARGHVRLAGEAEGVDEIEDLLEQALNEQAVIVYANTIARALSYYDWFYKRGKRPILYHARFTEPGKVRVEATLIEALGREAWEKDCAGGIAIMTQIGEMSINISAPFMISDLCPFDRLAQRIGRLSRFGNMPSGEVYVVTPVKDGVLYPAPYGEYDPVSHSWIAGQPLLQTQERLEERSYSANDFVDEVNCLYPLSEPFAGSALENQHQLREEMNTNWFIVPQAQIEEDDEQTDSWRSREIPPQRLVLTQRPPMHFATYAAYRQFELECGVACPVWEVEQGIRLGRVGFCSFTVGDDADEVRRHLAVVYSRSEGLILFENRTISTQDVCL